MGSCQIRCGTEKSDSLIVNEILSKNNSITTDQVKQRSDNGDQKVSEQVKVANYIQNHNQVESINQIHFTESIANEASLQDYQVLPIFISHKKINPSLKPRVNRFVEDIEQEVKRRIVEMQNQFKLFYQSQMEEEDLIQNLLQQHNLEAQNQLNTKLQMQSKQPELIMNNTVQEKKQQNLQETVLGQASLKEEQLGTFKKFKQMPSDSNFSFNPQSIEVQSQQSMQQPLSESYSPIHKTIKPSQFNTVHQYQQQGDSFSSYSNNKSVKSKSQNKKSLSIKDRSISVIASRGSSNELREKKAYEKMFSEFQSVQGRNGSNSRYEISQMSSFDKKKGILKYRTISARQILSRSISSKTYKTSKSQLKKKRVRFSQCTDLSIERNKPLQHLQKNKWFSLFK